MSIDEYPYGTRLEAFFGKLAEIDISDWGGLYVDGDYVEDILERAEQPVKSIAFDPWGSSDRRRLLLIIRHLTGRIHGFHLGRRGETTPSDEGEVLDLHLRPELTNQRTEVEGDDRGDEKHP